MDKIKNLLGLAYRARLVVLGDKLIDSIRSGKVCLVIVAKDIGITNKKKIVDKCNYYKIEYIELLSKEEISQALGKLNISNLGIIDKGFKELILSNHRRCLNG